MKEPSPGQRRVIEQLVASMYAAQRNAVAKRTAKYSRRHSRVRVERRPSVGVWKGGC